MGVVGGGRCIITPEVVEEDGVVVMGQVWRRWVRRVCAEAWARLWRVKGVGEGGRGVEEAMRRFPASRVGGMAASIVWARVRPVGGGEVVVGGGGGGLVVIFA